MFDKLIYPVLIMLTGFAYIITAFVKIILSLHKPINKFKWWVKIKLLWKLNNIHNKIKLKNKE